MIRIDGSLGEGGGQVLRTSLSLSMVTGQAFRIDKIRAVRERPGLLRQHLTAVLAAAEISGAQVDGAALGSTALTFTPERVRPGAYKFAVGTAGSGTLVLQTVLPPLMVADEPSAVVIEGGTHNKAAPPYEFMAETFLPFIERMGPKVNLVFDQYGFYPAGGGRFRVAIEPVRKLSPLDIGERGEIVARRVKAIVANLPLHIAEREIKTACDMMNWPAEYGSAAMTRDSMGPGNVLMIELESGEVKEVFTAFGELGVSAEAVASRACGEARAYLASRAAACEHLTDQLLLPMAMAGEGRFTAEKINSHARTNMPVISAFLPVRFETQKEAGFTRVEVLS